VGEGRQPPLRELERDVSGLSQDPWGLEDKGQQHGSCLLHPTHPQGAQNKQRRVKQLQFTTWPDHSIPEAPSSLLTFVELVQEQARTIQGMGPILVHCR
jgi:protein tyrosine phosphatase